MGHRRRVRTSGCALVVFGLVLIVLARSVQAGETVPVVVTSASGEHLFRAELADTAAERARGLMYREDLAPDAAMLFLFDPPQRVSFWMKNTYIPLDMLFADERGRIVAIAERTEPESLEPHGPATRVRAVLEINGGLAERLGIRPGDAIESPALAR